MRKGAFYFIEDNSGEIPIDDFKRCKISNVEIVTIICPLCYSRIEIGSIVAQCSLCYTVYHKDCWEFYGSCPGCNSKSKIEFRYTLQSIKGNE